MHNIVTENYNAKTDLKLKRGYAVYINTDAPVNNLPVVQLAGTAEKKVMGLIYDGGDGAATACTIVTHGAFEYAISGAAIDAGASVTPDTNGKLVPSTNGQVAVGYAKKTTTAGDQEFPIFVHKHATVV